MIAKKVYIASPFFSQIAIEEVETVKEVLRELGIKFFSPKDDNRISPDADFEARQKGFERNIREIDKCDFMIANTRDKDIGTSVEIGYALAKKKPVILFTPQLKGLSINLMLAQLVTGISYDKNELIKRINEYLSGYLSPEFKGEIE
jgi:nucleoside 2-deoxyribosyltransferase